MRDFIAGWSAGALTPIAHHVQPIQMIRSTALLSEGLPFSGPLHNAITAQTSSQLDSDLSLDGGGTTAISATPTHTPAEELEFVVAAAVRQQHAKSQLRTQLSDASVLSRGGVVRSPQRVSVGGMGSPNATASSVLSRGSWTAGGRHDGTGGADSVSSSDWVVLGSGGGSGGAAHHSTAPAQLADPASSLVVLHALNSHCLPQMAGLLPVLARSRGSSGLRVQAPVVTRTLTPTSPSSPFSSAAGIASATIAAASSAPALQTSLPAWMILDEVAAGNSLVVNLAGELPMPVFGLATSGVGYIDRASGSSTAGTAVESGGGAEPDLNSMEGLGTAYADAILCAQAHGPYLVLGCSVYGSMAAFATACNLEQRGHNVMLLLLDGPPMLPAMVAKVSAVSA